MIRLDASDVESELSCADCDYLFELGDEVFAENNGFICPSCYQILVNRDSEADLRRRERKELS